MGETLKRYLFENQRNLEEMVLGSPSPAGPETVQPSGASTFAMPEDPLAPPAAPTFGPEPTAQVASTQPVAAPVAAPVPTFDPQPQEMSIEQKGPPQEPNTEGGMSFDDYMEQADDEQTGKAIDVMEKTGVNIDEAYQKATGQPPPQGMSRKQKGSLLMEFGLNLMSRSASGQGNTLGDIGSAGLDTMASYRNQKAAEAQAIKDAAKSKTEEKTASVKLKVAEAQLLKAGRDETEISEDAEGNLILVNLTKGTTKMLTNSAGDPVKAGAQKQFASQVDRAVYEDEFCTGLTGAAMKSCRKRAVAYAKGVREVAFPGVMRADQTERVMKNLENPDNSSMKYKIGGKQKRWKEMSEDEQVELASRLVDRRIKIIEKGGVGGMPEAGGSQIASETLSPETTKGMTQGKIYTMNDGSEWKLDQSGKPVKVK